MLTIYVFNSLFTVVIYFTAYVTLSVYKLNMFFNELVQLKKNKIKSISLNVGAYFIERTKTGKTIEIFRNRVVFVLS